MELNELIKIYRQLHHLTMQEFGDRCGLSKGYISMLEKGVQPRSGNKITPSIETIAKVAKGMNLTPDDLVAQLNDNQEISLAPTPDELRIAALEEAYEKHRVLFDAADDATVEEIKQAADYLEFLKSQRG